MMARERELVSASASFLSGEPSYYFVETLEPTTLLSLTREDLDDVYRQSPRVERVGRLMTTHFVLQKEEWELEYMRMDTRERFMRFVEKDPGMMPACSAEIPGFLSEYETGDIQPVETSVKKDARTRPLNHRYERFHCLVQASLEGLYHYLSGYVPLTRQEFNQLLPYIEIREFDKKVKVIDQGEIEDTSISLPGAWCGNTCR